MRPWVYHAQGLTATISRGAILLLQWDAPSQSYNTLMPAVPWLIAGCVNTDQFELH